MHFCSIKEMRVNPNCAILNPVFKHLYPTNTSIGVSKRSTSVANIWLFRVLQHNIVCTETSQIFCGPCSKTSRECRSMWFISPSRGNCTDFWENVSVNDVTSTDVYTAFQSDAVQLDIQQLILVCSGKQWAPIPKVASNYSVVQRMLPEYLKEASCFNQSCTCINQIPFKSTHSSVSWGSFFICAKFPFIPISLPFQTFWCKIEVSLWRPRVVLKEK